MSQAASLAEKQAAFMSAILDDSAKLPEGWGNSQAIGIQIYRGNYRSALMGAFDETFERTARYVGEAPFKQVAAHHAIANPPGSWTVDDAGLGFDQTCVQLFTNNPEVAELAWLEWTMLQLAKAADSKPINAADFAASSAEFSDQDWTNLRLEFQPCSASRIVHHDLSAIWHSLSEDQSGALELGTVQERGCLVWREGERPTFIHVEPTESAAFAAFMDGANYGEVCEILAGQDADPDAIQQAAMDIGGMLGRWINEGIVTGISS
ncbi:MAG: DNA-binding domain-containing protein [Erythrobacter sp.]